MLCAGLVKSQLYIIKERFIFVYILKWKSLILCFAGTIINKLSIVWYNINVFVGHCLLNICSVVVF